MESDYHRRLAHDLLHYVRDVRENLQRTIPLLNGVCESTIKIADIDSIPRLKEAILPLVGRTLDTLDIFIRSIETRDHPNLAKATFELRTLHSDLITVRNQFGLEGMNRIGTICAMLLATTNDIMHSGAGVSREKLKALRNNTVSLGRIAVDVEFSRLDKYASALIARLAKSTTTQEPEPILLTGTIEEAIDLSIAKIEQACSAMSIDIRRRYAKLHDIAVSGINEELLSIMDQLLQNAVKYTGDLHLTADDGERWITIRGDHTRDEVQIEIESWGTPITPAELKGGLLFKSGYRGHFAIMAGIDGTGKGLGEVARAVNAIDGTIEVDTNPVEKIPGAAQMRSTKTVFRVRIPK